MSDEPAKELRVTMGSIERRGTWSVPEHLDVRVLWGNCELDLRDAKLSPGATTIDVQITMGNFELIVPPGMNVTLDVQTVGGNVAESEHLKDSIAGEADAPRIRVTGKVKLGNCEVITLHRGETRADGARRVRHERHHRKHHHRHERHARRHQRWHELHAEREMWMRSRDPKHRWQPWWLMSRMRRRMFIWFTLAFGAGIAVGLHLWADRKWWHIVLALMLLLMISGGIAWRLTRPLLIAIRAAQDIGDGKLDTRLDPDRYGGEVRLLATALNDMTTKIQQQLADQRQLLAAVSHELRTPLGHMRVLIETARDTNDPKALGELEKEVLMLDDLVGRLLAQSRLEFGNLDRRELDLGELVSDAATSAGVAPEAIEAIGDVRAPIDPTLVRRAVANLLDNARVHGKGAVAVRIERRANQVAIEVDDAGPGVPPDRKADAFRAFVPSSAGGLGLGLALVSRIAVAHDGGAWISERPGGGARVGFAVSVGA
ncbi:MAG: HAMP domain-containing protein [Deltaproteobacteria bacterium]|nr:HAMP domain-containing protein [Deltaproteobacteria bacterium]